jgi:hypothetical protein
MYISLILPLFKLLSDTSNGVIGGGGGFAAAAAAAPLSRCCYYIGAHTSLVGWAALLLF